MNVIILDACRDNPFGSRVPIEQKGLSQFDAPNGSLLSYATAPGNTADDGNGANGLFTENLLREMRVTGAKLEDVFKRVRLQVRLKSKGQQIPWESTSLEEDFYFTRTPEQLARISEEKAAALFAEELGVWNAAKDASVLEPFSAYLTRYPNGAFTQLAQVQLDRLLKKNGENKIALVSSASNPFTKGTVTAIGNYQVGDSYIFEQQDALTNVVNTTVRQVVTEVTVAHVILDGGVTVLDLMGNEIKSPKRRFLSPAQFYPAEYSVGAKWSTRFGWRRGNGEPSTMALDMQVTDRRSFSTPAGNFNAFKVVGFGWVVGGSKIEIVYWIDPEKCSRPLQFDMFGRDGKGNFKMTSRTVLVKFSQRSPLE
jgi:hypothetical protein